MAKPIHAEYVHHVVTLAHERGLRGLVQRLFRLPMYPVRMATFYAPLPTIGLEAAEQEAERLRAKRIFAKVYVESVRARTRDNGFAEVDTAPDLVYRGVPVLRPDEQPANVRVEINLPEGMDRSSLATVIAREVERELKRAPQTATASKPGGPGGDSPGLEIFETPEEVFPPAGPRYRFGTDGILRGYW